MNEHRSHDCSDACSFEFFGFGFRQVTQVAEHMRERYFVSTEVVDCERPVARASADVSPVENLLDLAERCSMSPIGMVRAFQRPMAVVESDRNPILALKSGPLVGNFAVAVVM